MKLANLIKKPFQPRLGKKTCPQVKDVSSEDAYLTGSLKRFSPETSLEEARQGLRASAMQSAEQKMKWAIIAGGCALGASIGAAMGVLLGGGLAAAAAPVAASIAGAGAIAYAIKKGVDAASDYVALKKTDKLLEAQDWKPSKLERQVMALHFSEAAPKSGNEARTETEKQVKGLKKRFSKLNFVAPWLVGIALASQGAAGLVGFCVAAGVGMSKFSLAFESENLSTLHQTLRAPESDWEVAQQRVTGKVD